MLAGPPSPAGAVCEDRNAFAQANVVDWTAVTRRSFPIQGPTPAMISPNGSLVALVPGADTGFDGTPRTLAGFQACGWIDDTHVIGRQAGNEIPLIFDITTGDLRMMEVPPAATGVRELIRTLDCAGRIPGGL